MGAVGDARRDDEVVGVVVPILVAPALGGERAAARPYEVGAARHLSDVDELVQRRTVGVGRR
jgi:hypothetical protein